MAHFGRDTSGFSASRAVKIVATEAAENHTVYVIEICLGPFKWTVRHRYNEFFELNERLVAQYKLDKNLLPPKKLFGNQSEAFIRKRQADLEVYLQTMLHHLTEIPPYLASFLDFHKYEIHGITQAMAEELFHKGDLILEAKETYHIDPLQLHAVTKRLRLPEPTCDSGDAKKDIGHILDFITRLNFLKVVGCDEIIENSNFVLNQLNFDLSNFKSLESLELVSCNCEMVSGVDHLKSRLQRMDVHTTIKSIKDVLLLGIGCGQWLGGEEESVIVPAWSALKIADFSSNGIPNIDESVKLMPCVEYLDLSHNCLEDVQQLQYLSALTHLDISFNNIHTLNSLHTKLGNIKSLTITDNNLESLQGFSKLYSLEKLDVSNNDLSQVLEIRHISRLPCLEFLTLTGNPVTIVVDYRTKILELFGDRAKEVTLDGDKPTQKELDTVAILLAIQKSKETKERAKKHSTKKPAVEATIADCKATPSTSSQTSRDPAPAAMAGQTNTSSVITSVSEGAAVDASSGGGGADAAAPNSPAPTTAQYAPDSPELFRMRVEAFREQGGDAWLGLLNQMHSPVLQRCHRGKSRRNVTGSRSGRHSATPTNTPHKDSSKKSAEQSAAGAGRPQPLDRSESLDVTRIHPSSVLPPLEGTPTSMQSTTSTSTISEISVDTTSCVMLPETLPGKSDTAFAAILQSLLPNTQILRHRSGIGGSTEVEVHRRREERTVHIMWCSAICYTDPNVEIPACLYTTTENLHVFQVATMVGARGIPELEHVHCIPLINIQQVVLGYQEVYLRIEEAFTGPQGTYTFLTSSSQKTENFVESLQAAIKRVIPEAECYEEPHFMINGETELTLKAVLNKVECCNNLTNLSIMLYMLVHAPGSVEDSRRHMTHSLVLTKRFLYLVQEDYIFWPQPTFGVGPSTQPRFQIIHSFPVSGRISGIQMYDSDTFTQGRQALPETFYATSATSSANFIGFGVKLIFDVGTDDSNELDIRVPTSGMRDRFLATLTQVRRELSEKSAEPHKRKVRKPKNVDISDSSRESHSRGSVSQSSSSQSLLSLEQEKLKIVIEDSSNGYMADSSESSCASGPVDDSDADVERPPNIQIQLPPDDLPDMYYPTMELLGHLTQCNENMQLLKTLPEPLQNLAFMNGEELLNFFHSHIAQIGFGQEELRHLLWVMATPYINPQQEIITCVMLSTKAIYFVSNENPKVKNLAPAWRKTHHRNKSDGMIPTAFRPDDPHHSSGILHRCDSTSPNHVRSYFILPLTELLQLNIGMFDQSFRISGDRREMVYACITRDNTLTETFVRQCMQVLNTIVPTPGHTPCSPENEEDIYKMFSRYAGSETLEFTHPSKVKFIYPSEDAVSDLTYLLCENIRGCKLSRDNVQILLYLLVFKVQSGDGSKIDYSKGNPRSLIVTNSHICCTIEDHVSYPLPDFATGLPDAPNFDSIEVRNLDMLKRVVVSDFTSHDMVLVFSDEAEEVQVNPDLEHFAVIDHASLSPPEVSWTLVIQNIRDRDRLRKLLSRQWSELHDGQELSIQVSS